MIKTVLTTLLALVLFQVAQAKEADSLVYYYKKSGKQVPIKDSADYYRVILPPDTNIDRDLYRVFDYYPDGKIRRVATSLNVNVFPTLDGVCMFYFPNGKRKEVCQYKNGRLIGAISDYYPNGKLYGIFRIDGFIYGSYDDTYRGYLPAADFRYRFYVEELRDSTGNELVQNGNGHFIIYDDKFQKVLEEGDLKNNKKEGNWNGLIADSGKFVCSFHKDELKSGTSYTNSGNHYDFKKFAINAVFSDGMDEFFRYIKNHLQYPEAAKKHNATGSVVVEFYVETDGRVTEVKAIQSVIKSLDDEAVRVISESPLWIPAYQFGIPIRSKHTVNVNFNSLAGHY
jgi:TonB family protein